MHVELQAYEAFALGVFTAFCLGWIVWEGLKR